MALAEHLPLPSIKAVKRVLDEAGIPLPPRGANSGRGMGPAPTTTRRCARKGVGAGQSQRRQAPELSAYRTD